MFGEGYSEFMDYCAIDAFPNPGYGAAAGMLNGPTGRPRNQDANVDLMVQKMADVCKINSARNLRCRGKFIHLFSQNGTTGWLCHTG
jgi:hypothetical protein